MTSIQSIRALSISPGKIIAENEIFRSMAPLIIKLIFVRIQENNLVNDDSVLIECIKLLVDWCNFNFEVDGNCTSISSNAYKKDSFTISLLGIVTPILVNCLSTPLHDTALAGLISFATTRQLAFKSVVSLLDDSARATFEGEVKQFLMGGSKNGNHEINASGKTVPIIRLGKF